MGTYLGYLLGEVVQCSNEVKYLHDVHPCDAEAAPAPRHVVRLIQAVSLQGAGEHLGSAAHEVVKEVVAQLDKVHDGLGALEDLSVEGRLDVRLKQGEFRIMVTSFGQLDAKVKS